MALALTVVFDQRMQAPAEGFSPSAAKPALVVAAWERTGLPMDVVPPEPATLDELARAHDRAYVEAVLAGRWANGFGTRDPAVARSLPYTTGAMLTGARLSALTGLPVCAPVSGFHHAGWDSGGGFCTFNGLMVTALAVLAEGSADRVVIIDCDQHYGDGTDEILDHLGKPGSIHHFTAGKYFRHRQHIVRFFRRLEEELAELREGDLVLYQAGADPHVRDPLGGWMGDAELRHRDEMVFEGVKAAGVPLVWNLAGGYQRDDTGGIGPVIAIHTRTALEHLRVFDGWTERSSSPAT